MQFFCFLKAVCCWLTSRLSWSLAAPALSLCPQHIFTRFKGTFISLLRCYTDQINCSVILWSGHGRRQALYKCQPGSLALLPSQLQRGGLELLLPLLHHFSFLFAGKTLAADSWGKEKPPGSGQGLDRGLKSLASPWPVKPSQALQKYPHLLSFLSSWFQVGWLGASCLKSVSVCFSALLTKVFWKRIVGISKTRWTYIFNCPAPFWRKQLFSLLSNSFGHEWKTY